MSEGDVSLIRDEDVLRRMWQQTEDFSKKKEIRAHMYRLREERLRNLYSPEPTVTGKGVASAMHVSSLADQSFQGLKSKEVRDAGSPPKDYCRADLKELSNAGWNVQSENKTTDDGHTKIRSVRADIEGRYDVDGGRGQFAAVDSHRKAHTEYHDDNTSVQRTEAKSDSAQREQVVRKTDDGTQISSTTSSTSSSSKFQEVSSSTNQVPYITRDDSNVKRDSSVTQDQFSTHAANVSQRDTSHREEVTRHTNTSDYERNLRRNEHEGGELVSRKVDYPDDNTKVIVETRCLPDGTRVTSTRKEFRTPAQTTRSEHHSSLSESRSYSTQQKLDQSSKSSKSTREYDIVESQKHADDYDFKKNEVQYLNQKNDHSQSQRVNQHTSDTKRFETRESSSKISRETVDCSQETSDTQIHHARDYSIEKDNISEQNTKNIDIKLDETNLRTDHSSVHRTNRYATQVDETDRRDTSTRDNQSIYRDTNETKYVKNTDDQINNISRNKDVVEVIEKKSSDQYQTTYQSDYTQKKVSNDWSPTHQAWASTLRADTPSSTRPTTRASTPGSTTSLRSSVSPDKTTRKPSSRGGSPNKIDRLSPSRHSTDRYSNSHSTHTVTESRTYKHTSPDRKLPASPTRQSPEKRPQYQRPGNSPDRKPGQKESPSDEYPRTKSPPRNGTPRPSASPERKPGYQRPASSPTDEKPGYHYPSPTRGNPDKITDISTSRPSVSPDRKPGYMRPTAASKAPESPRQPSTDRSLPIKRVPSESPERKTYGKTTIKEDHYKLIDEETKMYTRSDRDDTRYIKKSTLSPDRFTGTSDDVPDYCRSESPSLRPTLRKESRSPSPPKGPVTFTDDKTNKYLTTTVTSTHDEEVVKTNIPTKPVDSPLKEVPREPSPSKYGTYDKKRHTEEFEEVTTTTRDDAKYDSLTRRGITNKKPETPTYPTKTRENVSPVKSVDSPREPSPSKYDTYDKKHRTEETEVITSSKKQNDIKYDSLSRTQKTDLSRKVTDVPLPATKKSPRDSVSPVKSPTKDAKYKHTTDFITNERRTENVTKKTSKDHPRQLVTPSTSPTRKPITDDTAPSTGQSSPTTSVSGFIYFSSPKTEKTIVTDLDDFDYTEINKTEETDTTTTYKRPSSLDVDRSQSPSKIPCRSPSPGKQVSPTKESLPRKSSLKKPSTGSNSVSPVEKPPSSFRVSPTDDLNNYPEHKIIKKDHPDKPIDSPAKTKPPFERRETYEERCLKILGVVDDKTTTENVLKKEPKSSSVSPCHSPVTKESSPFRMVTDKRETTKVDVTDFITREQEDTRIQSETQRISSSTVERKSKTPSRETSPATLQDIISQKTETGKDDITSKVSDVKTEITESPDRDIGYQKPRFGSPAKEVSAKPKDSPRPSPSLDRKSTIHTSNKTSSTDYVHSITTSKETTPETTLTPEQKPVYKQPTDSSKVEDKYPRTTTPIRSSPSPDRKPGYMQSTTATSKKFESTSTTSHVQEDLTSTTVKQTTDRETGYDRTKESPKPERASPSPDRKPTHREPSTTKENSRMIPTRSSISPDRKPGYMRPTAATITKFEEKIATEDFEEIATEEIIRHSGTKSPSPSRLSPSSRERSSSPVKKSQEPKHSRTPSPLKKTTVDNTLLIQTEREQEVLDRVQQSLRKLSPNREQRSPSREKSPGKTTISLQDIDFMSSTEKKTTEETLETETTTKNDVTRTVKPKEDKPIQKPASKPPSRTVSPTKKPTLPSKTEKTPESPNKSRSISPKKPISPTERPQSPQIPKASGIKPRESTPSSVTRKPTSSAISPPKTTTTDTKKTSSITKQNSATKISTAKTTTSKITSTVYKTEPEQKRALTPKGINKENVIPKKEDTKVTRTASDTSLKNKKPSPQRMKSKPEIQVNDLSPTRIPKGTPKKSTNDTQTKLAPKPKSATALNTPQDDDDVLIDVEQAKSSRENSPDRICPTPVGFADDVGTPRYPDEVREPDDEFRQRTHQTIHETESIVDDIVEISEDEELFVKRTGVDRVTGSDECLLSVTDKVSRFTNKIEIVTKPKDITTQFQDTEKRIHSDFVAENLRSDECLLSVSEKVNKFAKCPRDSKDRSPARKITDEYDTATTYQDDYTKLSVNDKAHLFVETAENSKTTKTKPAQKVDRPDLSDVDDALKTDDCLLSVSDKVNKFVKTAEQFLNETRESEEKEKFVREQYEKFMKQIKKEDHEHTQETETTSQTIFNDTDLKTDKSIPEDKTPSFARETASSHTKVKDYASPNLKPTERTPTIKMTSLRSSEAVKKAKALFENIATTTQTKDTKTTKLMDIGVIKKSPKTDSTIVLHPSVEEITKDPESEVDAPSSPSPIDRSSSSSLPRHQQQQSHFNEKRRSSPNRHASHSPEVPRAKSPMHKTVETTTTKTVLSRYPAAQNELPKRSERETLDKPLPKQTRRTPEPKQTRPEVKPVHPESEKPEEKIPSYQRPTKTSQIKEEKTVEETEVTTRRGSGKFGVELRRTSLERSTVSSERRRSSDHHQPCIEDIFDLDLLEQMLEKVVGYEQRRRIRAQIRVAKKKLETEHTDTTYSRSKHTTITKTRSPERRPQIKSPEYLKSTPQKNFSPEPVLASTPHRQPEYLKSKESSKPLLNGHAKEPSNLSEKRQRPQSPEKPRFTTKSKSPVRHSSPEKKTRTSSPTKVTPKTKSNRFNEYATAYMKKVGLNETDKGKLFDKTKKTLDVEDKVGHKTLTKSETNDRTTQHYEEHRAVETKTMSKSISERTSSKDTIEIVHVNGHQAKRSPSPEKKRSPERPLHSPSDRLYQRSPSPDFKRRNDISKKETVIKTVYETEPRVTKKETIIKTVYEERPKMESNKKETIIKTVYDIEKKTPSKTVSEEKPSWVTNRNLKKTTAETRTFSSKKVEEKKARAASPSKALVRPIDVITSSYGPGPLDADGRPLFGIKALRNGTTNYQVKGTVIRQEFHSRNGSEPEGSVSVTAYSTEPEDLERLLQSQGEKPSRIHGLAAITTTKKFGGETGTTLKEAHSREERAALDQFTHNERRVTEKMVEGRKEDKRTEEKKVERREDKKTVRQSSVKSLTEKYIKSASDTSKSERTTYPKAGLILRSTTLKDSASSDSSQHAGLGRTNSAHSLGSVEDHEVVNSSQTKVVRGQERSFLDSSTKVSGVQDILTRMKNADIVIQDGDTTEDSEARALLNKFLGASVLMAGMQAYVTERPGGNISVREETVRTSSNGGKTTVTSRIEDINLDQCWDEGLLRKLLEESTDYEQRRRIRARIRSLMAEQEACASAVTEALAASGQPAGELDAREEEEVTVTSSVRRNSSEKTVSSSTTTKTSKVIESMTRPAPKPVSPFAKFRQLEKQNSVNSPNSPTTPQSPGSPAKAPYFKFTDPALQASALTIKERLLQWCRDKTRDYENVKLENFSTSWADGLAFCALVHHFLPDAFDYSKLTADKRRHNFTLAFKVADEKAGIYPLLDVDDMVAMRKPDWKCVFTYVQAIHRRFKDQP